MVEIATIATIITIATLQLDEAASVGSSALPRWLWIVLIVLAVLVLAGLIWALVAWRRRRAVAAPAQPGGPSVATRLRELWRPFYNYLPRRALHFPTIVVVGEAGVGKSHVIGCHVDWRGQANQFAHNVVREGLLQLYLGPDTVVHEISAPLLRDVSRGAKRGLEQLWSNMGPSATVVVVLDARTLASTPPAALRELAQLVRGKISLFPRRCQTALELRIVLAHLDQIDGYDEFAATLGRDHGPLDLGLLGPEFADASRLIAAYDGHLAYALTKRTGDEFDRMVRFYGVLPELLGHLRSLLASLHGNDEPYGVRHRIGGLYLGALVAHGLVGDPFVVEREQIASSIDRHNRRGLRGGLVTAGAGLLVSSAFFGTHLARIETAEAALTRFESKLDEHEIGAAQECSKSEARLDPQAEAASGAAAEVTAALIAVKRSENLWLAQTFKRRKRAVEDEYESTIRQSYLYPLIPRTDRVHQLFVMALLYASHDNELGQLVLAEQALWARELQLSHWVIEYYVRTSDSDFGTMMVPQCEPTATAGGEWSKFLRALVQALDRETVGADELRELAKVPPLRSRYEYQVLGKVRALLGAQDSGLPDYYREKLLAPTLDSWSEADHATLERLAGLLRRQLVDERRDTSGWGLAELVAALSVPALEIDEDFEVEVEGEKLRIDGDELAALITRSRAHLLITKVLAGIDARELGRGSGLDFFSTSDKRPKVGAIKGYGGGPRKSIDGRYSRAAFEEQVSPVLRYASERLHPRLVPQRGSEADTLEPLRHTLTDGDARRLEQRILAVADDYAIAYRNELFEYYRSFELSSVSEMTLPFIFKAFIEPSSWFTEFLRTVTHHATPTLPEGDEYFEPMREALLEFGPLVELLVEDKGVIPGLEPYQALLADLQPALAEEGRSKTPNAPELRERLSAIGALMLDMLRGSAIDHDDRVRLWLLEAGIDARWHAPFRAPVREAQAIGIQNIHEQLGAAWTREVRPLIRPLLQKYPFNPLASSDASIDELEALVRLQGKDPGEFWLTFDRLIGPVTIRDSGGVTMIEGLRAPAGMLALTRDLERMARTLWDQDGAPVPLKLAIKPLALPKEPHEGRTAAMAYIRGGGGTVYAFNQRPESQILELQWWNQDTSVVSLELRAGIDGDPRSHSIELEGPFSFYRLLDQAKNSKAADKRATLTETAINAATRCYPGDPSGTKNITVHWRVPVDDVSRTVKVVLISDPWAAFAVRDCGW